MRSYYNKTKDSYYFVIRFDEIEKVRRNGLESELMCASTGTDCGTKISLKFDSFNEPDFYIKKSGIDFETSDDIKIFIKDKKDKDWEKSKIYKFFKDGVEVGINFT